MSSIGSHKAGLGNHKGLPLRGPRVYALEYHWNPKCVKADCATLLQRFCRLARGANGSGRVGVQIAASGSLVDVMAVKLRIVLKALGLTALALLILATVTPQGRTGMRTLLLLPQMLPTIPVKPQEWVAAEPTRREVAYPQLSGKGVADLYVPPGRGRHGGVLLFLGVNPAGRDDERVVGLAKGLARAGVVVMIPWSDTMTQKRIALEEVDNLVRAFQYMRNLNEVDPDRLGMGGFCVGASLSAVAAQDPRIREQVEFVNFFGGYYDARDLVRSVVTKSRFHNGNTEAWSPDSLSEEVVAAHLIESLPDPQERSALTARFIGEGNGAEAGPGALSPGGQAVHALLSGPAIEEVDGLIARLPEKALETLRTISPSTHIEDLSARVLIMHDREDSLVPSEESRRLAEALGDDQDAYYTEFSLFQHVDPTRPASPPVFAREAFKLFLHMYNILRELS